MKTTLSILSALVLTAIATPSFALITVQNPTSNDPEKVIKALSNQDVVTLLNATPAQKANIAQQPLPQPQPQAFTQQPQTAKTSSPVKMQASSVEPKLSFGVFARQSNDTVVPANTNYLSRSNPNHRLCWIAFDSIFPNQVEVEEQITAPTKSNFSGPNSRVVSSPDGLNHTILTTLSSLNNEMVERCWKFDTADPIGRYEITIKVGEIIYPTQSFEIVK